MYAIVARHSASMEGSEKAGPQTWSWSVILAGCVICFCRIEMLTFAVKSSYDTQFPHLTCGRISQTRVSTW